MRRSGSSSCMLRPRHSLSQEDLQRLVTDAPTTTVLTIDRLPSYCTDRLYMLSELQVHANSIKFLCDNHTDADGNDSRKVNLSSIGVGEAVRHASGSNDGTSCDSDSISSTTVTSSPAFPPSIILYLLWKPNTYPTPGSFADGPLSECVRQCLLANGEEAPENELEDVDVRSSPRNRPSSSTYSPRRRQLLLDETSNQLSPEGRELLEKTPLPFDTKEEDENVRESASKSKWADESENINSSPRKEPSQQKQEPRVNDQQTRIYVVVDRISPSDADEALNFNGMGELPNFPDILTSNSSGSMAENVDIQPSINEQPYSSKQNDPLPKYSPTKEEKEQQQLNQHNNEVKIAEKLARAVASSRFLRNRIDGISIGITSDARAAPGLEACMDTLARGAKERRLAARDRSLLSVVVQGRKKKSNAKSTRRGDKHTNGSNDGLDLLRERSPERSPIAIVAMQPDDLEGGDHHHHHNHNHQHQHSDEDIDNNMTSISNKVLQCRVSTEWKGLGEYKTFSDRAMNDWRQAWIGGEGIASSSHRRDSDNNNVRGGGGGNNNGIAVRPKVPRISHRGREDVDLDDELADVDEPISTVMVIVFLGVIAAYVWNVYGDLLLDFFFGDLLLEEKV